VKVKAVSLEVGADFGRDVKPADRKSILGYGMLVRAVLAEKVVHFAPFLARPALKWSIRFSFIRSVAELGVNAPAVESNMSLRRCRGRWPSAQEADG
jgi:hypothetical protein